MCCVFTVFMLLGPRFAGIIWWIAQPIRWVGETNVSAFNSFIWPILGLLFVPWTTFVYVLVAPGGINGFWEWLFLILALVLDISTYAGGGYGNRDRMPGYGQ